MKKDNKKVEHTTYIKSFISVEENGMSGILDTDGNFYATDTKFESGLMRAKKDGQEVLIDRDGRIYTTPAEMAAITKVMAEIAKAKDKWASKIEAEKDEGGKRVYHKRAEAEILRLVDNKEKRFQELLEELSTEKAEGATKNTNSID